MKINITVRFTRAKKMQFTYANLPLILGVEVLRTKIDILNKGWFFGAGLFMANRRMVEQD